MKAIDMELMEAAMDQEDTELMQMFRGRRNRVDETVMVKDGGALYLIQKADIARAEKEREDIRRAAETLAAAVAVIGLTAAGWGNPVFAMLGGALMLGYLWRRMPQEVRNG